MPRHLTGFDEEVALGQFGEILENDSVVMTVDFTDAEGKSVNPPNEPLWRGVTMLRYVKGRWRRQAHGPTQMYVGFAERGRPTKLLRQRIKLEGNDSPTLFGIRPIRDANSGPRLPPYLNPMDGTLLRQDTRGGSYDYEVSSDPSPGGLQPGEEPPSPAQRELLLSIESEALKAQLRQLAEPVIASVTKKHPGVTIEQALVMTEEERAPIEQARLAWTEACARALESYLRDSGLFSYTLHMQVIDDTLDPVEDFLVNRRMGHCEYFASALALLLRSIDIPARMVNGFKGGDWNDLTQTMNVREKHAHSWVEAYGGLGPAHATGLDQPRPDALLRTRGVDRPGRRYRRQLPSHDRPDSAHLGVLHHRIRPRPSESTALRADATDDQLGAGKLQQACCPGVEGIRHPVPFSEPQRLHQLERRRRRIPGRATPRRHGPRGVPVGLVGFSSGFAARESTRPRSRPASSFTAD